MLQPLEDLPVNHLLEMYKEARSHYRHIESSRTQYLGFFFTVFLGSLGFIISRLEEIRTEPWTLLGTTVLVLVVNTLTTAIFMLVRKARSTLDFYVDTCKRIELRIFGRTLLIPSSADSIIGNRFFSNQNIAEWTLVGTAIILGMVQVVNIVAICSTGRFHLAVVVVLSVLTGILIIFQCFRFSKVIRPKKRCR